MADFVDIDQQRTGVRTVERTGGMSGAEQFIPLSPRMEPTEPKWTLTHDSGGLLTTVRNLCARIEVYLFDPMKLSIGFGVLAISLLSGSVLFAQASNEGRQEFGITVGELSSGAPSVPGDTLNLNAGVAVGANFARKFRDLGFASLYWEIEGSGWPGALSLRVSGCGDT